MLCHHTKWGTHNRVTRLVWWHTFTRHVKWNKFPSHTWLPYLTPNGVTHLIMPLSTTKTDKILHNLLPILNPLPNGWFFLLITWFQKKALYSRFFCQIIWWNQQNSLSLHRFKPLRGKQAAQMAESVDALVSNTSGATRAGSTPALGTSTLDNLFWLSSVFFVCIKAFIHC